MGLSNGKLKKPVNLRKSVKSIYILKKIFSLLSEKRKLIIIIYNKKFKAKLKIGFEHYKKMCLRYIIGELNGKGQEYDKMDRLRYDGELLNGKRNGYGKEYYTKGPPITLTFHQVVYEGEFLKGERNGNGKEYDYNGNVIFEGEYLKGKRNGKGKEFYDKGKLKFEGEYLNGKKNGKGNKYFKDGQLKFEGEYLNGVKIKGNGYNENGDIILNIEKKKLNFLIMIR